MYSKGISVLVSSLLLIFIAVLASIVLHIYIISQVEKYYTDTQVGLERLKVDGYKIIGDKLILYVRNIGDSKAIVCKAYIVKGKDTYLLDPATYTGGTEIWGGDVWRIDNNDLKLVLSGKILYDDFSSRDPSVWDDTYVDYNNKQSKIYYSLEGLKLLSQKQSGKWAVRGLITNNRIVNFIDLPIVLEVDLQKTNHNVKNGNAAASPFATCLYLSSSKNKNPYNAIPWFAVKLYPWNNPKGTVAQLVTRDRGKPKYENIFLWRSSPNSQPRGIFLLVFNETGKVYYYFWANERNGTPSEKGFWNINNLGQVYVYLTIDTRIKSSFRKVHIRYIKIYKGTSINVENVEPGWTVQLVDSSGKVLKETIAEDTSIEFDILDLIIEKGMPLEGYIKIMAYNNSSEGWVIDPGEVKDLHFSIPSSLRSGTYMVKIVTDRGTEAYININIP